MKLGLIAGTVLTNENKEHQVPHVRFPHSLFPKHAIELPKNVTHVVSNCYPFKKVNVNKQSVLKMAHQTENYVMFLTSMRILSCTDGKETCQIKIQMNVQWNSQD